MLKIRPCCFKMAPEHRVLMLGIQISQKALARPSNSRYPPAAWECTDQRCRRKAAHHWVRPQGREHEMKIFPQWVYMYHLSLLIEFSNSLGAHSLFIYFPVSLHEWLVWVWYVCWLDCQIYSRGKINSTPYPDHSLMCLCRWCHTKEGILMNFVSVIHSKVNQYGNTFILCSTVHCWWTQNILHKFPIKWIYFILSHISRTDLPWMACSAA